jgi:hypothetical protein
MFRKDIMPLSSGSNYKPSKGQNRLSSTPSSANRLLGLFFDLKMEEACSSETSDSLLNIRCYNPEDSNHHDPNFSVAIQQKYRIDRYDLPFMPSHSVLFQEQMKTVLHLKDCKLFVLAAL